VWARKQSKKGRQLGHNCQAHDCKTVAVTYDSGIGSLNYSAKMFANSNSLSKSRALRAKIAGFDGSFLEITWILANTFCIIAFQLLC